MSCPPNTTRIIPSGGRLKCLFSPVTIPRSRMNDPQTYTGPGLALSSKALRTKEQPISFLIAEALRNPKLINLAAGLVDPLTLPVEECDAITRRIFTDTARGRVALQYDTTLGLTDLRRTLLGHVEQLEGC